MYGCVSDNARHGASNNLYQGCVSDNTQHNRRESDYPGLRCLNEGMTGACLTTPAASGMPVAWPAPLPHLPSGTHQAHGEHVMG
ncbi:MAG: hypothetical protein ACK56F_20540 [bacterium]